MDSKWLNFNKPDLLIERQQLLDEGMDMLGFQDEFDCLSKLDIDNTPHLQVRLQALFDQAESLSTLPGYPYTEPSELHAIRLASTSDSLRLKAETSDEDLYDHIYGAWLGRCAGCLLGLPIEGWRSSDLWPFLMETANYPLSNYIHYNVSQEIQERYKLAANDAYIDRISHMVEDDDINYTVTALAVFKQYGQNFTPADIASFWMGNIPILHTYTAERVAYRNFCNLISPPRSARFRNPYREWIGAQIRADFWGYVALGNPHLAAEYAWRDASISHIRNGIYGEMWVAAMLAAAAFTKSRIELIEIGLSEIPTNSRFSKSIRAILKAYLQQAEYDEVVEQIHTGWDERNPHHWCHTISNAEIVAAGLLWGAGDFEKSICRAVQACFDTDCNGATVGSIIGMMLGAKALPEKWIGPLHDTLDTGISGYNQVQISHLAEETLKLSKTIQDQ